MFSCANCLSPSVENDEKKRKGKGKKEKEEKEKKEKEEKEKQEKEIREKEEKEKKKKEEKEKKEKEEKEKEEKEKEEKEKEEKEKKAEKEEKKETKEEKAEKERVRKSLLSKIDVDAVWTEVDSEKTVSSNRRPGWQTVRIFVSSTFKDFHQEREILVKQVFTELRGWCESRQLYLIDCDLRWGVPEGASSELTVTTCLEEIDRCYEYNEVPFFVNLTSERIGWIPLKDDLPQTLWEKYNLVYGLSVTEMEIVHGAYRIENPNALFLFRDESFLEKVTDKDVRGRFFDEEPKAEEKLKMLKDKIRSRFPKRVITYTCEYIPEETLYSNYSAKAESQKSETQKNVETKNLIPKLKIEDITFAEKVLEFFKRCIGRKYPPVTEEDVDEFVKSKNNHGDFMRNRCGINQGKNQETLVGREDVLQQINDYIRNDTSGHPMLIVGDAGSGKSSIMAKAASDALKKTQCGCSSDVWNIFFHFVGAVPKSTSLFWLLRRLLKELDPTVNPPEKLVDLAALVSSYLSFCHSRIVIFIDALNQIDKETHVEPTFWIPEKLSPNVRCILSLITDSDPHKAFQKREEIQKLKAFTEMSIPDLNPGQRIIDKETQVGPTSWIPEKLSPNVCCILSLITDSDPHKAIQERKAFTEISVPDLNQEHRTEIMNNYLSSFNKRLEDKHIDLLLKKDSSKNPLWLRIASEEMRIYGNFRSIDTFIGRIEDGLPQLLQQVLKRFEDESDKVILKATLCLLEVSKFGLLEDELLEILADRDHLEYNADRAAASPEESRVVKQGNRLPYAHWASVYRNLRTYLRPYGNPSEGRLDFYHRTLSKVVRDLHLSLDTNNSIADDMKFCWWHKKLVDYFRSSRTYDRKVEEYPHHLLFLIKTKVKDEEEKRIYRKWLQEFLLDKEAFERLYDNEFSSDLLLYWRDSGDEKYDEMCAQYQKQCEEIEFTAESTVVDRCIKFEQFSRVMGQAGRNEEALKVAERCLKILTDRSDEMEKEDHDEKLMQLYSHIGHVKCIIAREIPEYHEIIDWHAKAIEIIKNSEKRDDIKYKKHYALQLNKTAFARGELFRLSYCMEMFTEGVKEVDQAIELYREIKDYAHELEAQLTKATLYREHKDEQLKIYELTSQRCEQIFGKEHHLMCRLNFNTAIVYEESDDFENGYKHFHKAYELGLKVFGDKHSSTELYRNVLNEERYKSIREGLGHNF